MNIGDHTEVLINTVAFGGDGIGKLLDLVVFVPFTIEGDLCDIKITAIKKNYLKGHLEKLLKPSHARTKPLCPYYQTCGGCQYQHVNYSHQTAIKQRQVRETFERIGKIKTPDIRKIIPSPQIYHYRGKADFQIQTSKGSAPAIGFIDTSNRLLIPIERCEIVDESINATLSDLRQNLEAHKTGWREDRHTIWSDPNGKFASANPSDLRKPKYIERSVKGKHFQVPYNGFFQTNTALVDKLVDTVEDMCSLVGNETVLDAYCGSGLFAIFLATKAKQVLGIDSDGPAIRCAKINCRNEGLDHAAFYRGDVAAIMKAALIEEKIPIDCVVLDPPRSGCEKDVLDAVIALKPSKTIYVSCNPATQARDIRYLIDRGASLKYIQPLDMFPQTAHIEAVALLEIR